MVVVTMIMDVIGNINNSLEERYRVLKRLGVAGTSQILIAKDRKTTSDVVIKVFNGICVPREVQVLQKLCHPTIVSIYDSFPSKTTGTYNLVMPMLGKREMDLFEFIEEHGPLSESVIAHIFAQLVSASIYLHQTGSIAHCDIKVVSFSLYCIITFIYISYVG